MTQLSWRLRPGRAWQIVWTLRAPHFSPSLKWHLSFKDPPVDPLGTPLNLAPLDGNPRRRKGEHDNRCSFRTVEFLLLFHVCWYSCWLLHLFDHFDVSSTAFKRCKVLQGVVAFHFCQYGLVVMHKYVHLMNHIAIRVRFDKFCYMPSCFGDAQSFLNSIKGFRTRFPSLTILVCCWRFVKMSWSCHCWQPST